MLPICSIINLVFCGIATTHAWVRLGFMWKSSLHIFVELQPTLKAVLVNHTQIFDPDYIEYNITATKAGVHDVYINIRRSNMKLFANSIIDFETKKDEYGIHFMNKTFDVCKFLNSRRYEPLLQLLYDVVLENPTSLLPRRCPIKTVTFKSF